MNYPAPRSRRFANEPVTWKDVCVGLTIGVVLLAILCLAVLQ